MSSYRVFRCLTYPIRSLAQGPSRWYSYRKVLAQFSFCCCLVPRSHYLRWRKHSCESKCANCHFLLYTSLLFPYNLEGKKITMALHLMLGIVLNYVSSVAAGNTGIASYYGGNLAGGNCLFSSYTIPAGIFGTALSGANWNTASLCGACLSVTGPRGNIKVMVILIRRPKLLDRSPCSNIEHRLSTAVRVAQ